MEVEIVEETQMEEQDSDYDEITPHEELNEEKRMHAYVLRLKLAVAIAVIQSTPPDMTPENYASYLVQTFTNNVDAWKTKCETLEREIFSLEQQLQSVTLRRNANFPDTEIIEETPMDFARPRLHVCSTLETKISTTIEFVRSFIMFGSVADSFDQSKNARSSESLRDIILRSTSLLFDYLRSEDGLLLEFSISKRALEEVNRLLDARANFFEHDLMVIIMDFVENLLRDIYKTLEINKVDLQHRRSALIQMLAENKRMTARILCRLLREITVLSDSFVSQLHPKVEDFYPLLHMENVYYVLQATEGILHIMRQQNSALNAFRIPKALLAEWNKTTRNSLLEISACFPMYSIYVWHVKALMESVLETEMLV